MASLHATRAVSFLHCSLTVARNGLLSDVSALYRTVVETTLHVHSMQSLHSGKVTWGPYLFAYTSLGKVISDMFDEYI